MRQRNPSPYPIVVMAADGPFEAAPGEVVDFPDRLAGFELVTDDEARHETPEAAPVESAPVEPAAAPAPAPAAVPAQPVAPAPLPAPIAGVVIPPPPGAITTTA